jgi:hypothetical protein
MDDLIRGSLGHFIQHLALAYPQSGILNGGAVARETHGI